MDRTLVIRLTPTREAALKKAVQYIAENGGKGTKPWSAERVIEAFLESEKLLDWANEVDPRPRAVIAKERREWARSAEASRLTAKDEWQIVPNYALHGRDGEGRYHPDVLAWFRAIANTPELRVRYTGGWWGCLDCGSQWDGLYRGEKPKDGKTRRFWECPECPSSIKKRCALDSMRQAWARDFKGRARAFMATEAKAKRTAERESRRLDRIAAKLTEDQADEVYARALRRKAAQPPATTEAHPNL
jgi:hypothetical protein